MALAETLADADERLFWTLMRRFETVAIDRYRATAPALATDDKCAFVRTLIALDGDEAALAAHILGEPTEALLETAQSPDEPTTLLVQGLLLERLGQAIYGIVVATEATVSDASRALARTGRAASETVTTQIPARLATRFAESESLWEAFADVSYDVLGALDALATPVDVTFGRRFGLRFAEVMGEFTADLVSTCATLGMPRRKVVSHLAGAAMGL